MYYKFKTSAEQGVVKCAIIRKGLNGRWYFGNGKAGEKVAKHRFQLGKTLNFEAPQNTHVCVSVSAGRSISVDFFFFNFKS